MCAATSEPIPADAPPVPAGAHCVSCEYELAGLDRDGPCPECGTPIRESIAEMRPVTGVRCVSCEYELTGLAVEKNCPECGKPIADSVIRPRLALCPPEQIRPIYLGLRVVFWLAIASFTIVPMAGSFLAVLSFSVPVVSVVFETVLLVVLGYVLLRCWLAITRPPREMPDQRRARTLRGWILAMVVMTFVCEVVVSIGMSYAMNTARFRGAVMLWVYPIAQIGMYLCMFLAFVFKAAYLRRLARFIPDTKISNRFRTLFWFLLIACGSLIGLAVVGWIYALLNPAGPPGGTGVRAFLAPLLFGGLWMLGGALLVLVFFVGYLVGVYQLGSRAHKALLMSRDREAKLAIEARRNETGETP